MGKIGVLVGLLCCLAGCAKRLPVQAVHPVVSGIEITVEERGHRESLRFDTDSQTSPVLNYLRTLGRGAPAAVNPEHTAGAMYTFTLELSNGASQTFRQKGAKYFMDKDGLWYAIAAYSEGKLTGVLAFCSD